nr:zinc transporter ZIP5 [Caretta caretta]
MDRRKPRLLLAGLWVAALLLPGGCGPPLPAAPSPGLPASAPAPLGEAEQEQGYYLQQLFGLYGENGTLSFHGLTRLLRSLGLGRVQVVEMEHEALGHGHVAHLDVLEVQDKHRRQSALEHAGAEPPSLGPELQGENGPSRPGSPGRNQPETVRPPQADPPPQPPAASGGTRPPLDTEGPSTTCAPGRPGSRRDPVQAPPALPHLTLLERVLALDHSVTDHLHEDCLNVTQLLVNFGLNSASKITPEQFALLCPALLYQIDSRVCIRHYDPLAPEPLGRALWPVLGWGFLAITLISLPSALALLLVPWLGGACGRLLLAFLVALAVGTLCGDALLHLWPHVSRGSPGPPAPELGGPGRGGLGLLQIHPGARPRRSQSAQRPPPAQPGTWAQGRRQETPLEHQASVLKGLSVLGGIYLLFLIEHLLGTLKQRRRQPSRATGRSPRSPSLDAAGSRGLTLGASAPSPGEPGAGPRSLPRSPQRPLLGEASTGAAVGAARPPPSGTLSPRPGAGESSRQPGPQPRPPAGSGLLPACGCSSEGTEAELRRLTAPGPHSDSPVWGEEGARQPAPGADGPTAELSHQGHSHGPAAGTADIAWMVILGDGIHNLTDGLAIGAAFSEGVSSGLSTALAVFCHELPHELGDFALLLQAGLPVKRVLLSNLMSASLAYLGMAVGTALSQGASPITPWIFSITAGIFLYVALVDMLPEMLRQSSGGSPQGPVTYFALQNLGFLLGATIMMCIALFEGQMSFRVDL